MDLLRDRQDELPAVLDLLGDQRGVLSLLGDWLGVFPLLGERRGVLDLLCNRRGVLPLLGELCDVRLCSFDDKTIFGLSST